MTDTAGDEPYEHLSGLRFGELQFLNLERLRTVMRRPVVFDGRNVREAERMRRRGFEYYSIGRAPVRRS